MSDMHPAARTFFSARHFAVAGASSTAAKFGHRIFAWYLAHNLPVTPLNPSSARITVRRKEYPTVASPLQLADPAATSLSVVTPPPVTAKLLREAREAGVKAVWLQPGSFGEEEWRFAVEAFPGAAVGGMEGGTAGAEGWCVLVDGEAAMAAAGRRGERL